MRARSALTVVFLVGLGLAAVSTPAHGVFHLMKVREVHAGTAVEANADFVELQMYQAGQNQVNGHKLTLFDDTGRRRECTIPGNVPNPANQETILFATSQAQTTMNFTADFTIPAFLEQGGGAVCFENIDCVSWGGFPGGASDQDGGPGNSKVGGIPIGESIERKVGANGTLEASDDTNDSSQDFENKPPSPNPNGLVNLGTANCTAATGGGGGDTTEPSSKITAPKHRTAIDLKDSRNFQGSAKDQEGGDIAKVELALRQKTKGGCNWWNGSSFASGPCAERRFFDAQGTSKWSYDLPRSLKRTGGKIRNYILFSRATDTAGNTESEFIAKANKVKFEVFKAPITCGPQPC